MLCSRGVNGCVKALYLHCEWQCWHQWVDQQAKLTVGYNRLHNRCYSQCGPSGESLGSELGESIAYVKLCCATGEPMGVQRPYNHNLNNSVGSNGLINRQNSLCSTIGCTWIEFTVWINAVSHCALH